ncbi:MAG TPA: CheR family methyltransferase, partial [Gaiellaceae bacterium]
MSAEPDPEFEQLLEFVRDARGFDYTGYRRPTLLRRFDKRLEAVGVEGWAAYRAYLEQHPEEFGELFNMILINVTGFFRDKETWDVVAAEVIPQMLAAREEAGPIRVWSAGCASGEEPYTVAMLLAEAMGEQPYKERVKIYATDVDGDALAEAREATYTAKQLADVPEELRERYFQPANGGFAFRSDLRRSVIFGRNDLHRDPPISRVDLLVSRNTLMYFSPEIQERILSNFYFSLRRGGYLVVGKAEALQQGRRHFSPYNLKRRIFVKDGEAEPAFHLPAPALLPDLEPGTGLEFGDAAFEQGPVAQLVVDDENRLAVVNLTARVLFDLKSKDIGRAFHELEVSYRPVDLRTLIDQARQEQRAATVTDVRWGRPNAGERSFDVSVAPLTGMDAPFAGVSITFVDVTPYRSLEGQLDRTRRE